MFFEVAPVKKPDPEDPSKKIFDYVEPAGKSLLSNAGKFLEMLQDFDKDNIPDKVIKKVGPYIENPDFTPKMCDLRVLRCCGAFTLSMRLVSRRWVVSFSILRQFRDRVCPAQDREGVRRVQGHLHVGPRHAHLSFCRVGCCT